jgi:hypothetical protein
MLNNLWNRFIALSNKQRAMILVAVFFLLVAGSLSDSSTDTEQSKSKTEATSSPTPSVSPTSASPTPSDSPTVASSPIPESPVRFRTSALGDLSDMRRDVSDAKVALSKGGQWKLYGNLLEIEFNLGQLESLTPQPEYEKRWYESLLKLQTAVDTFSEGLDEGSVASARRNLDKILSAISGVEKVAKSIG